MAPRDVTKMKSVVDITSSPIKAYCRIYASMNRVNVGSDNGLTPIRRQTTIQTNTGLLSIGPLGTQFSNNSNQNRTLFILEKALENVVCKTANCGHFLQWYVDWKGYQHFARHIRGCWLFSYACIYMLNFRYSEIKNNRFRKSICLYYYSQVDIFKKKTHKNHCQIFPPNWFYD